METNPPKEIQNHLKIFYYSFLKLNTKRENSAEITIIVKPNNSSVF